MANVFQKICPNRCSTFFSNDLIIIVVIDTELSSFTMSSSTSLLSSFTTPSSTSSLLSSSSSCCHRIQRASNKSPSLQLNATSFLEICSSYSVLWQMAERKIGQTKIRVLIICQKINKFLQWRLGILTFCYQLGGCNWLTPYILTSWRIKTKVNKVTFQNQHQD